MALTAVEAQSALATLPIAFTFTPVTSGTIEGADLQHICWTYRGITLAAPAAATTQSGVRRLDQAQKRTKPSFAEIGAEAERARFEQFPEERQRPQERRDARDEPSEPRGSKDVRAFARELFPDDEEMGIEFIDLIRAEDETRRIRGNVLAILLLAYQEEW